MALPRADAAFFVEQYVPRGWHDGSEWTWAIRHHGEGELLGVIGYRLRERSVGYWVGAPFRGAGLATRATGLVTVAVFARTDVPEIVWECVAGNAASMAVAVKAGFVLRDEPVRRPGRGGALIDYREGVLRRS